MAIDAHIIFCPYSYVLDPVVRRAMDVDLTGAIVIFDEAQYDPSSFCSEVLSA